MKTAGELVNFLRGVPPSTPVDINGRDYEVTGGRDGVQIVNAEPKPKPKAKAKSAKVEGADK